MKKIVFTILCAASLLVLGSCGGDTGATTSAAPDDAKRISAGDSSVDPYAELNSNLKRKFDKAMEDVDSGGDGPFERSARVCADPKRNDLCTVIDVKEDTTFGQLLQPVNRNPHMLEAMHTANDWRPGEVTFDTPVPGGTKLAFSYGVFR